jgi:hypothetical protein
MPKAFPKIDKKSWLGIILALVVIIGMTGKFGDGSEF